MIDMSWRRMAWMHHVLLANVSAEHGHSLVLASPAVWHPLCGGGGSGKGGRPVEVLAVERHDEHSVREVLQFVQPCPSHMCRPHQT